MSASTALGGTRGVRSRRLRRSRAGRLNGRIAVASAMLVVVAILAVFAPIIAPFAPDATGVGTRLSGPTGGHLLGTDQFGRDELSRMVFGARISLGVALGVTAFALVVGGPIGMLIGYRGGWFDSVVSRVIEVAFAFPSILLALVLTTILGPGLDTVFVALVIIYIPIVVRFVRGAVIAEKASDYIVAARVAGASPMRVMARHLLPNIASPVLVLGSSIMAFTVLAEAALSYLGFGTQPPTSSWGKMLTENTSYFQAAPHLALVPGLAITYLVLAFTLLGDGLRDRLDPMSQKLAKEAASTAQ